ncbi:GNAT family N-acetyltransferase [Thermaerobacillus caldiproteolyticus]|uniref:GNAT family N-acetyltransferase n=1 Tax=Thermaerobacillus caldiproteolyticus TaxID=247480 RepID=UPI00188A3B7C|nr:GNAT family N-acetyltransferase [Anoxybacillus caldiproteolyticus]QPA32630.1 GNAT family N-acetyltransferase [Anoxybacillus caldiproteolyticus]
MSVRDPYRHPVVILYRDTTVGFFVLHEGKNIASFTNNRNTMLIRAFSVNLIHQGKRCTKRAFHLLTAFVMKHFPNINEIVLAVNETNKLYEKSRFQDKGIRRMEKIGLPLILQRY